MNACVAIHKAQINRARQVSIFNLQYLKQSSIERKQNFKSEVRNMNSQAGDQKGKGNIKSEIDELINQERVVIFSKESCPYCVDARNVFDEIGQSYSEVDLNTHPKGEQVQDVLKEMTGASTVPRVFVDGKCIGGGVDTVELYKTGKLEKILKTEESQVSLSGRSQNARGEKPGDGL